MLRSGGVKPLRPGDLGAARALCDLDPVTNVFVAARLDEGMLASGLGAAFAVPAEAGELRSMLWASANLVPVGVGVDDVARYAARVRRTRRRFSSIFGPAEPVLALWQQLSRALPAPMSYRPQQPLMVASPQARERSGVEAHPEVRAARLTELDAVVPAAAAMFTEEIGYRPYVGSDAAYRAGVAKLIRAGRTFVLMDAGRVRFKADVGSLASGVAQIQGVWVDPAWRGRGLAAPCMARVVELVGATLAGTVSLYVNDYNVAALRAYRTAGFEQVDTFATVIL